MFSICGIGLMQTNNIGFVIVSLFPKDVNASDPAVQSAQNLHVSIISTCNFAGRLLCGFLSDFFYRKRRFCCTAPRILWPLFASIFMLAGSLVGGLFVGGINSASSSLEENLGWLFWVSVFMGLG
jgi:MFS family permease